MIKYALVDCSYLPDEGLEVHVVLDNFENILDAEKARSDYLKLSALSPQNIKVLQYDER